MAICKRAQAWSLKASGPSMEFKSQWPKKAGRTLAAMANASGGWLLVGVDDKGRAGCLTKPELVAQKQDIESHISEHLLVD